MIEISPHRKIFVFGFVVPCNDQNGDLWIKSPSPYKWYENIPKKIGLEIRDAALHYSLGVQSKGNFNSKNGTK